MTDYKEITINSKQKEINIDRFLTTTLLNLGIPTRNMGFFFSKECAKIIYNNPMARFQMSDQVFKVVSEKYGTSVSKIERAIRHTISIATSQKTMHKLETILNTQSSFNIIHPSVCEFLCLLAESLNFIDTKVINNNCW